MFLFFPRFLLWPPPPPLRPIVPDKSEQQRRGNLFTYRRGGIIRPLESRATTSPSSAAAAGANLHSISPSAEAGRKRARISLTVVVALVAAVAVAVVCSRRTVRSEPTFLASGSPKASGHMAHIKRRALTRARNSGSNRSSQLHYY